MQENEFEKQVQQKMDDLKIIPSPALWAKIEAQVKKEKRRRWIFIFLPVLITALLYVGYTTFNRQDPQAESRVQAANNISQKNDFIKDVKTVTDSISTNRLNLNKQPISLAVNTNENVSRKRKSNGILKRKAYLNVSTVVPGDQTPGIPDTSQNTIESNSSVTTTNTPETVNNLNGDKPVTINSKPAENEIKQTQPGPLITLIDTGSGKNEKIIAEPPPVNTGNKNKSGAKNRWDIGLSFIAGASAMSGNIFAGIFGDEQKSFDNQGVPVTGGFPASGGFGYSTSQRTPSTIRSSFAFITGLAAEKNITPKIKFTTGLNYKLFSTRIRVGADSASFYRNNNLQTYQNRFHYIEIPAGFKLQVTNGNKLKLFIHTAVSISRLVSSNALQFNSSTGLYYHNNSLFNKTQTWFNAGFDINFYSKQKRSIYIGPYIIYGLSKTAREGYNKHPFTFAGIKTQYFFRKD